MAVSSPQSKTDHTPGASEPRKRGKTPSTAALLLSWYDANRRVLPWRARPGERSDPYRVWLSEVMLQQTTVAAVIPYYLAFLERWPDIHALAGAALDDVLAAWAGLGYYSRARNLHRAAQTVATAHGGMFPSSAEELRELPGVGLYISGAVAAIAFGERVPAMDANAERVVARLFAVEEELPRARARLFALAMPLVSRDRPGDFAQAMMDLGARICLSKRPLCGQCPLAVECEARRLGIAETLPRKAAKAVRPLKRGAAYVAQDSRGAVYLERRPDNGLLGGMLQPPLGEWTEDFPMADAACADAPFSGNWSKVAGVVRHGFTHFQLEMEVYTARFSRRPNGEGFWLDREALSTAALPTVMRKVLTLALNEDAPLLELASN